MHPLFLITICFTVTTRVESFTSWDLYRLDFGVLYDEVSKKKLYHIVRAHTNRSYIASSVLWIIIIIIIVFDHRCTRKSREYSVPVNNVFVFLFFYRSDYTTSYIGARKRKITDRSLSPPSRTLTPGRALRAGDNCVRPLLLVCNDI